MFPSCPLLLYLKDAPKKIGGETEDGETEETEEVERSFVTDTACI